MEASNIYSTVRDLEADPGLMGFTTQLNFFAVSLALEFSSLFLSQLGDISSTVCFLKLGKGHVHNSFLIFFNSSFLRIITRGSTVFSHLYSIALVKVTWCVYNGSQWCLPGWEVAGTFYSAAVLALLSLLLF